MPHPPLVSIRLLAPALLLPLWAAGCSDSWALPPLPESAPSTLPERAVDALAAESAGGGSLTEPKAGLYRRLALRNVASRMEAWRSGLVIDLGSADQHKYTRGGWRTGWRSGWGKSPTSAAVPERAELELHDPWGEIRAVKLRLRSPRGGQRLTLYFDGEVLGRQEVGKGWTTLSYNLERAPRPGRHRLVLLFRRKGNNRRPAAEVDWVWLPTAAAADRPEPPTLERVAVRSHGSPRRSLVADPPSRLSYYLRVPKKSTLAFHHGAAPSTEFEVRLSADGAGAKTLYKATVAGNDGWRGGRVDLGRYGGALVRLDLITRGSGGQASWGEPELMGRGKAPRPIAVPPSRRPRNLVYVLVDTARQDVYKPFNPKTRVAAPAMEQFARTALRFQNAYANDNWTKPSVATALSGLYSSTHGTVKSGSVLPDSVPLISQHLRKRGFVTAAFIANGYVSDKFGFKKGWSSYRNYIRERRDSEAEYVYGDALKWLERRAKAGKDKPFFLYIQTIDPHVPYQVEPEYVRRYQKKRYRGRLGRVVTGEETHAVREGKLKLGRKDEEHVRALYDAEITYHDEHFGKFIEGLRRRGLHKNTLVVVSNDHGEEMFDHGEVGHGHSLYEELVRCPLLLSYPPLLQQGRSVATPVELVDLVPTMLALLGQPPMKNLDGVSLLGVAGGRVRPWQGYAISEFLDGRRSVRLGHYKLIVSRRRAGLFDLSRDPDEQKNRADEDLLARRACEVHLYEGLATPRKLSRLRGVSGGKKHRAGEAKVDGELKKQLEALGYID